MPQVTRADAVLTYALGLAALWLSYSALADLALRSGLTTAQAAVWPLVVDGLILAATRAVVTFGEHPARQYAWCLLAASAVVSIAGNAAHALLPAGPTHPAVRTVVAVVPPIVALAVTHLAIVRARVRADRAAADDATVTHHDETTPHDAAPRRVEADATHVQHTPAPADDAPVTHDATHASPQVDAPDDAPDTVADAPVDSGVTQPDAYIAAVAADDALTIDERIAALAAAGLSNYAIADCVGMSESSVRRRRGPRVTL